MAGSFAALRAKQGNALERIQNKISAQKSNGRGDPTLQDETFWNIDHVRGPDGVGAAIVRFLPAAEGEDDPFITWIEYQFQGPNGWYINRSRTSLGPNEKDPVYEYNGRLFKDKTISEDDRKKRLLGRRQFYVANILVIKDPNKPENEGKVLKWKFGPQIFNIIESAMFPDKNLFPDAVEINPFDPIDGANFVLRVTTKQIGNPPKAVPSYEKSSFNPPAPLVKDADDFDAIWARQYKLRPLNAPDQYDTYENLLNRFNEVMGINQNFLDRDDRNQAIANQAQGTTQAAAKRQENLNVTETPEQTTIQEQLGDEIPDFPKTTTQPAASEFTSADDDNWFNSLKT